MIVRKLGKETAKKVLHAMARDPQHFSFIKITENELADLASLYSPTNMPLYYNVYSFRAGVWVVMITDHREWVEVTIINPYDLQDHYTVSNLD